MDKYNLTQTGQEVQNILNEATPQSELTAETERAQLAEQQLQNDINAIEEKIPSGASSSNKLATEEYVDDSVSTATATFRGTFNLVSDLGLTVDATEQQIAAALASEISTADNNDYCFVQIPTSDETPTEIEEIDRYKFNGTAWSFEYELNNSGFTADQWDAINSHIKSGDVAKLLALPTNAELTILLNGKQDVLTFDNVPTENSNNPVKSGGVKSAIDDEETRAKAAEKQNADDIDSLEAAIEAILLLIPTAASSLNQLADKAFVNSSIATNTATFRGTFNLVNDLHLTLAATHAQVGNALALAILDSDNNDYCFVQIPTVETAPNEIAQTDRYKFNGSTWEYEYTLNNSGFTSAQWIAINSGITSVLVSKLSELPTNSELTSELGALTTAINNINLKIPAAAAQNNKLVDTAALEAYIIQVLDVLTVTYNVTSSDGHVTFHIAQTDGKITAVTLTTNDIASANDLTVLAGRVTTAENDIDALEFRVGTNEADIALLQAAYGALTQSDPEIIQPTDTWPVAHPALNVIYRVVDRTNTPPQYYSDYMWNGTAMVLIATYDNAIDDVPTAGSNNLVKSGGVYNELALGAVYDVSAKNPTAGPNNDGKWESLSALLSDANLSTLIPTSVRKGGMSIKFVQSSGHKYLQFRLKTIFFSNNVKDWEEDNVVDTSDIFFNDASLDVADESDHVVLRLQQGHIKTKNFDSAKNNQKLLEIEQELENIPNLFPVSTDSSSKSLALSDEHGNDIAQFNGGHIKTKNFNSAENNAKLAEIEQEIGAISVASGLSEKPFAISDENNNDIVQFDAGHLRTKNFNSKEAKINYYLKRPQTGKHCFSVSVNCYLFTLNNSLTKQDQEVIGTDYGYIALPENYSPTGEPTRLIIYCHGSGAVLSDYQNPNAVSWAAHYECWLKLGYAFMDMYAAPTQFTGSTTDLHLGNPTVLQCYRKGYEYVQRNFNIKRDGIFVIGASMGGLSSIQICMSGMFPVIGYIGYCPVCDLYKQAYLGQWNNVNRQYIADFFNFTGKEQVIFTSSHIGTAEERQIFKDNIEKWSGFNPILLHADNELAQQILSFIPSLDDSENWNAEYDQAEAQTYENLKINFPVPAKIFHCSNDTTVLFRYSKYFVDAIRRGGGQAWFRPLPSGGHSAWAAGDDVSVVGIDGQSFTMKASTYEAYLFVKRLNNN